MALFLGSIPSSGSEISEAISSCPRFGNNYKDCSRSEWPILDCPKRMKIAIGSARGLAYLHDGSIEKGKTILYVASYN
ncbi:hypothetical protein JHK87_000843 [Glycine soja]|nr:hypothetical protein JHK87_000843 [Glycine soja]